MCALVAVLASCGSAPLPVTTQQAPDGGKASNPGADHKECQADSECGPGGRCAASLVGARCACLSAAFCKPDAGACYAGTLQVACACGDSCGHGSFCHGPDDACSDDADCGGNGTCNFDIPSQRWTCSTCWPFP